MVGKVGQPKQHLKRNSEGKLKKTPPTETKHFSVWSKAQKKVVGYRSRKMFRSCSLLLGSVLYATLDKTGLPSCCTRFPKQCIFEWKLQLDSEYYLITSVKPANAAACHPASVGKMSGISIADFWGIFRRMGETGLCPIRPPDPGIPFPQYASKCISGFFPSFASLGWNEKLLDLI